MRYAPALRASVLEMTAKGAGCGVARKRTEEGWVMAAVQRQKGAALSVSVEREPVLAAPAGSRQV
jgi:hypothetical protein